MQLGLVIHSLNPTTGGVASATVELARALALRGHRVTLITFDAPDALFLSELPKEFHLLTLGPTQNSHGFVPRLAQKLAGRTFDFLILNGLWLHCTAGMARWARQHKTPYALFPHGMLDPYFKRSHPLKHFKKLLYWLFIELHTVRRAEAIFYTTASERTLAQNTFPFFHPRQQEVIGLGLQSSPTSIESAQDAFLSRFPQLRGQPYLLYLGRFHSKKGTDLLLVALEDFPQLTLVMAGPLHNTHPAFLKDLMSLSTPRVIWTDLLTGPAKWGALAAADALILPSHQENFGMVVAEALSVGTPALVSRQVALAPDIEASHAGFTAPDTLAGTHTLLEKFAALTGSEKALLRRNARACYEKNYQPATVAERLENSIKSLI